MTDIETFIIMVLVSIITLGSGIIFFMAWLSKISIRPENRRVCAICGEICTGGFYIKDIKKFICNKCNGEYRVVELKEEK
jgi:hypothetical protein